MRYRDGYFQLVPIEKQKSIFFNFSLHMPLWQRDSKANKWKQRIRQPIHPAQTSNLCTITSETGEAFGFARQSGATRYPWSIERYEEEIQHRTSDDNPANTLVLGTYTLTQKLQDRTLRFESDEIFSS